MFIHPSTYLCVWLPTCFPVCLYTHSCIMRSPESFPQSFNHPSGRVGYTQLNNMREAFRRSQFVALYSSAHARTRVPVATGKPLSAASTGIPANSLQLTERRRYISYSYMQKDTVIRHIDLTRYIYVYTYIIYIHVTIVSRNCFDQYVSVIHLRTDVLYFAMNFRPLLKLTKYVCEHRHKYLMISRTIVNWPTKVHGPEFSFRTW
jgi:hypothetical protein